MMAVDESKAMYQDGIRMEFDDEKISLLLDENALKRTHEKHQQEACAFVST